MATVQEVIRRLSIESTTKGVDEATAKLKQLEAGYKGVTVEGQKSETATQSMEKRFASIQRQYDENYRAVMQLAKVERDLSMAQGQGLLSVERKNELLALAARRYTDVSTAALKALAAENAVASQQASASQIQQWAGLRGPADASRGADIAAYGRELDNLRAKFNPAFAANRQFWDSLSEINSAYKVGAINEKERSSAMDRARVTYQQQSRAIHEVGAAAGFSSFQVTNLGYQLNDVVSGLVMGQSPFMIMAQQGGQVYQILGTHPAGVGGAIKQIGSMLTGLITPARLAMGGILAIGGAALVAQNNFRKTQIEIENSLRGTGGMAGVRASDINAAAYQNASITGMSVAEARTAATAIAASGRIAAGNLGEAILLARDLSKVMGVDIAESSATLAKAFRDPVRGAQELNERLGAFDAATMRTIQNLRDQGRIQEANLVLTRSAAEAIKGAAENTTGWSKAWNAVSNSISNGWNGLGQFIDRAMGYGEAQQQINELLARRKQIEDQLEKTQGGLFSGLANREAERVLSGINSEIDRLQKGLENSANQAARTKQNLDSIQTRGAIDQIMPDMNQRQTLENRRRLLETAVIDSMVDPSVLDRLKISAEGLGEAYARAARDVETFAGAQQRAIENMKLQIAAVGARSPAELANAARLQMEAQLRSAGVSGPEADERIRLAGLLAYTQAMRQLSDAQRDRATSADLALRSAEIDLQVIGKSAREVELLRLNFQTYSDLRREAERNNVAFDDAEYRRLKRTNEQLALRRELVATAQLRNDLSFERDQMGRSEMDQAIASRLRGAGLPIDLNSAEASMIRMNEQLKLSKDLASDFAGTFTSEFRSALRQGENFWDSFANAGTKALTRIADKLMDMAVQDLVGRAFGASGFNFFSLFGGSSAASGGVGLGSGNVLSSLYHTGGVVGTGGAARYVHPAYFENAPRYHDGGIAGDEVPAVLKRGEIVSRDMNHLRQQAGNSAPQITIVNHNDFRGADPSQRAFIETQLNMRDNKLRADMPAVVARYVADNPQAFAK